MRILAIESSAKAASCALWRDGQLESSAFQATGLTHSRTLLPMVEDLLKNCEVTPEAVDVIAVAAGPGSFTGLRIGIAAVKGLAWALDKPCVAVSTLEAMASPFAHLNTHIVCAMDARRQQIYNAVFLADGGALDRMTPDRAIALSELAEELDPSIPYLIVGDGAQLCYSYLKERDFLCEIAPPHLVLQSAVGVAIQAEKQYKEGKAVSAQELSPVYLRLSQAERERLERLEKEANHEP